MSSDTPISTQAQVVLIDDDPHLRQALSQTLDLAGLKVASLGDARDLAARLPADWQGVVVSDIRMPGIDGLELLQQLRARDSELPVILITGHGDIQLAVQAMRAGAYDFLEKPFPSEALLDSVRRALALRQLVLDNRSLRLALADRQQLSARLLGQSRAMLRLREQIGALAGTQADVLILGETGAGKEVVARALHDLSNRRNGPFVAINTAAIPKDLLESELFGHERGAFTGAQTMRRGRFEQADGGTLFLDEVSEIPLPLQVKLLRFLQEKQFERVGGNETITVDVRIVAASNRDLAEQVKDGDFREDLYYRLNVVQLDVPPLRARRSDIPLLAEHFVKKHAEENGFDVQGFSDEALLALMSYPWPGNVRELDNAIERAVVMTAGSTIETEHLPALAGSPQQDSLGVLVPGLTLAELERQAILQALEAAGGSTQKAAELLGISRRKIQYRLKEWGQDGGEGSET